MVYEPHDINCEGNGCMWKISLENVDNFDVTHMQYVMDFFILKNVNFINVFCPCFPRQYLTYPQGYHISVEIIVDKFLHKMERM